MISPLRKALGFTSIEKDIVHLLGYDMEIKGKYRNEGNILERSACGVERSSMDNCCFGYGNLLFCLLWSDVDIDNGCI